MNNERRKAMSKKTARVINLLVAATMVLSVSLACGLRDIRKLGYEFIDEALRPDSDMESRDQYFEDLNEAGERPYDVTALSEDRLQEWGYETDYSEDCVPEFARGGTVPARIVYQEASPYDTVTISDEFGVRQYKNFEPDDYEMMFCRRIEEEGFTGDECIDFISPNEYQLRRITEVDGSRGDHCYWAYFTVPLEDQAAQDKGGSSGAGTIEDCLSVKHDFNWEISLPRIEKGDGVTSCLYIFDVRNRTHDDQSVIIYETNSTGTDGMQWEGWKMHHLAAHDYYEFNASYVDYYGRGGDFTWSYPTAVLILRQAPECFWLNATGDAKNIALYEQYADQLENPCK
jgi:hypothetical protein